jgi:predicted lactoylglutathione lyase
VSRTAHPGRGLFVSIPVADLTRSKEFFTRLGFTVDPDFTDESAARLLVGEQANVMLLDHATFAKHSTRPMGDPATQALALYSFAVATREDVDAVADAALAAGAVEADEREDFGFMLTRSFFDLDGHGWQVLWMAPVTAESPENSG